ncbi:MAG: Dabb family protein [Andreesenia angusta]|nr:Dabb family protein [Andreesenia angusta]
MIKHIVMWNFKENANGKSKKENILEAKEKIEGLKNIIESIIDLELGVNIDGLTGNYDLVLYTEFKDEEGLEYYQKHPEHLPIVDYMREVVESRACVDYKA